MHDTQTDPRDEKARRGPHRAAFLRQCQRRLETVEGKLAYWQHQRRFIMRELRRVERLSADQKQ